MRSYWRGKAASVRRHRFALQVSAPSLGGFLECNELREANGLRPLGFPGWNKVYWLQMELDLCSSCTQQDCHAAFSATPCSTAQKRISLLPTYRTCPGLPCGASDSVGCPVWEHCGDKHYYNLFTSRFFCGVASSCSNGTWLGGFAFFYVPSSFGKLAIIKSLREPNQQSFSKFSRKHFCWLEHSLVFMVLEVLPPLPQ